MPDYTPGPIKWSISLIASETGLSRNTVRERLSASERDEESGTYTTKQVAEFVFGAADHKVRKLKADASLAELKLQQALGQLLSRALVESRIASTFHDMRAILINAQMPDGDRDALMNQLADAADNGLKF
jgi:hypothetical protein